MEHQLSFRFVLIMLDRLPAVISVGDAVNYANAASSLVEVHGSPGPPRKLNLNLGDLD